MPGYFKGNTNNNKTISLLMVKHNILQESPPGISATEMTKTVAKFFLQCKFCHNYFNGEWQPRPQSSRFSSFIIETAYGYHRDCLWFKAILKLL